jgi:hypothetical protein
MRLEATGKPICYRFKDGREVLLQPGFPVEVSEAAARQLLKQAAGQIRVVDAEPLVITLARRADGTPLPPVYWESAKGEVLGPGVPEFVAKADAHWWIVMTYQGDTRWIRSDRLRSRKTFERQLPLRVVDALVPRVIPGTAWPVSSHKKGRNESHN